MGEPGCEEPGEEMARDPQRCHSGGGLVVFLEEGCGGWWWLNTRGKMQSAVGKQPDSKNPLSTEQLS